MNSPSPLLPRTSDWRQSVLFLRCLPKAKSRLTYVIKQDKLVLANDKTTLVNLIYAGYDKQNKLVGVAMNAAAQGYQDIVKILYGYTIPITAAS